ncbi:MAG TPA: GRP family sugar transporter [Flavobacterium sp.]|uniref:GRP family sugar transporter n=1 Tax=unclassified Flavobacterium TaxID=196869 RepID=UPI0025BE6E22|nr:MULTISPECIES: GRP family sugar transporter [unclassified Flavobacterium]HRE77300.1 GRP family sugar transporter [Flavobacterium sp.]
MIYIVLSVLFNAVLFVILKLFSRFNINTLQALVVNYFTAFVMGLFFCEVAFDYSKIIEKQWYPGSFMLGFLFIGVFYATAITSQRNGLSVASVASKMSVIIPISFGVLLFNEKLGIAKIIGIIMALIAVYFTSKKEKGTASDSKNLLFPLLVFVGAGAIDTSLKVLQNDYLPENEISLFSSHTFLMAFSVGIIIIGINIIKTKTKINGKNILAGIILGIPNYFSLYYLIKMLDSEVFESSTIFTIHNVAIVMVSTLVGILFFNEKISMRNAIGIAMALLAIFLVTS